MQNCWIIWRTTNKWPHCSNSWVHSRQVIIIMNGTTSLCNSFCCHHAAWAYLRMNADVPYTKSKWEAIANVPDSYKPLFSTTVNWQPVVHLAACQVILDSSLQTNSASTTVSNSTPDTISVLSSLGIGLAHGKNRSHMAQMEVNFMAAALGLCVLVEVSIGCTWKRKYTLTLFWIEAAM